MVHGGVAVSGEAEFALFVAQAQYSQVASIELHSAQPRHILLLGGGGWSQKSATDRALRVDIIITIIMKPQSAKTLLAEAR